MKTELIKQRVKLLSEVDRLQEGCNGCEKRRYFNNLKDATGLAHACRACPAGQEIGKYGEQLLSLTNTRKKLIVKA